MFIDDLSPIQSHVGYGDVGWRGNLGYEGKTVKVRGQNYSRAMSTHPPARVIFQLGGRFASFHSEVALNDDVPDGRSHADFVVFADGRQVASVAHVMPNERPRQISVDISGAQLLELVVNTSRWDYCHAVWLDPRVEEEKAGAPPETLIDCLGRAEIALPARIPRADRCIATVVSPGFETWLDDMLGSLQANGCCSDAALVVFAFDANQKCLQVADKYGAVVIHCRSIKQINPMSKSLLYSVARVVDASQFLCLDADMLVLDSLRSVLEALSACPSDAILACREGNGNGLQNIGHALRSIYGGKEDDSQRVLGMTDEEANYPLVVNDGIFAGGKAALLALDGVIRSIPRAVDWVDSRRDIWWRNQFIFNLALARLRCGVELDGAYNVQLHVQDVQINRNNGRLRAVWRGQDVRVLHFSGVGKRKYPQWRGLYARVQDPLTGAGNGDGYDVFLKALRGWIGLHGLKAMAWSFYGTTDASTAVIRDPATMPLLALLHYIIRANGCVRVMESGTARGVSAACMASAIAHRSGARLITFDPQIYPERNDLWDAMPADVNSIIEHRAMGAIEGMTAALAAGERYDAALLDSMHTEEHVLAEFELAKRLVCPGGLILVHDVRYLHGTVERAVQRIEEAGYGVARLWTAESGVCEDDRLGLAVIENRPRSSRQTS